MRSSTARGVPAKRLPRTGSLERDPAYFGKFSLSEGDSFPNMEEISQHGRQRARASRRTSLVRDLLQSGAAAMPLVAPHLGGTTTGGWIPDAFVKNAASRRTGLAAAMALSVAFIGGLAYWDAERESAAALDELAEGQATLARALAASLHSRVAAGSSSGEIELLQGARTVERPGVLAVMLHRQGDPALSTTSGARIRSIPILEALDHGASAVTIPRQQAASLGLAPRTAVAGIARVDRASAGETWDIITVASAEHERDREKWARRRLLLSVLAAAGLVAVFGGLAMRNQRKELVLGRELALAAMQQTRDEKLQRASKAAVMGTLAMGVAHEISTPLGIIAARAEQMIPKVASDERLSGGVAAILSQTDRIKQVIQGLLGLARGDAPSAERVDPSAVVDQAVGLVEHRFLKAGVRLRREVEARLPSVLGDPRLLEHAVINLLLNACDACKVGDDVIVRAEGDRTEIRFVVEDTGAGISLADVGRAREPFFTTKARGEGTGLGLAIAHEIVSSHRGTLEFSPGQACGTSAVIRLPPAGGTVDV